MESGVLRARGEAPLDWSRQLESRALLIAGIRSVDLSGLVPPGQSDFTRAGGALAAFRLQFGEGSSEVRPEHRDTLEQVAATIKTLDQLAQARGEELSVEVVGHTDSTGPDSANKRLGLNRATRTAQALERAGVRNAVFHLRSAGSAEPIAGEGSESERQLNRCVTFRVLRPSPAAHP